MTNLEKHLNLLPTIGIDISKLASVIATENYLALEGKYSRELHLEFEKLGYELKFSDMTFPCLFYNKNGIMISLNFK